MEIMSELHPNKEWSTLFFYPRSINCQSYGHLIMWNSQSFLWVRDGKSLHPYTSFLNDGFVTEIVSMVMSRGLPVSSSNKTNKLSPGWRNDLGRLYQVCDGMPASVRNETQYRPMLCPLTQASPFPMEPRFNATGSSPLGASKTDWQIAINQYIIGWVT